MKTLNKIIEIFSAFVKCKPEMYEGPAQSTIADALFYLKEYQYIIEQCTSVLSQKYPSQNDAITWDELTQMAGKPIWLESYDDITKFNGWTIIRKIIEDKVFFIIGDYDADFFVEEIALPKCTINKKWKTYRAENK